jgi:hypothetical protein
MEIAAITRAAMAIQFHRVAIDRMIVLSAGAVPTERSALSRGGVSSESRRRRHALRKC